MQRIQDQGERAEQNLRFAPPADARATTRLLASAALRLDGFGPPDATREPGQL